MTNDSYALSPAEEHFQMSDEGDEETNIYYILGPSKVVYIYIYIYI